MPDEALLDTCTMLLHTVQFAGVLHEMGSTLMPARQREVRERAEEHLDSLQLSNVRRRFLRTELQRTRLGTMITGSSALGVAFGEPTWLLATLEVETEVPFKIELLITNARAHLQF